MNTCFKCKSNLIVREDIGFKCLDCGVILHPYLVHKKPFWEWKIPFGKGFKTEYIGNTEKLEKIYNKTTLL